jgi:hypothetical protein
MRLKDVTDLSDVSLRREMFALSHAVMKRFYLFTTLTKLTSLIKNQKVLGAFLFLGRLIVQFIAIKSYRLVIFGRFSQ